MRGGSGERGQVREGQVRGGQVRLAGGEREAGLRHE